MEKYIEYSILIAVSFFVAWLIAKFLRRTFDYFIQRSSKQLHADPTNFIFLKNSISFICYGIALIWVFTKIPYFKNLGAALFASAGVLAAFIGLASQKAFSNIIGGVFILIFKPFRVGDSIRVASGNMGIVEEITLRHTIIKDYEFRRVVIPNSIISEDTIVNNSITDTKIRRHIDIGIGYDAEIAKAENLIRLIIEAHPNFIDNRTTKEKTAGQLAIPIKVVSLGDFSVTLRAFVWSANFESSTQLQWDILRSVKEAFDKHSVEIPYPYRTIIFKDQMKKQSEKS